jgi:hypothetical protein
MPFLQKMFHYYVSENLNLHPSKAETSDAPMPEEAFIGRTRHKNGAIPGSHRQIAPFNSRANRFGMSIS